jgi:DNA-binding IscR family transcriptional regulator
MEHKMSFEEIHRALWQKEKLVTFKSLTSNKTHTVKCTIKKAFQSTSDKIVVIDVDNNKSIDIEVKTVQRIEECI